MFRNMGMTWHRYGRISVLPTPGDDEFQTLTIASDTVPRRGKGINGSLKKHRAVRRLHWRVSVGAEGISHELP